MRAIAPVVLLVAVAGAASAEVRSSSGGDLVIQKEVLSGGGGISSVAGKNVFCSFAQPQTGLTQGTAAVARLGFLAAGGAPPDAPQNLTASPAHQEVSLDWDDNTEPNIIGYNVYRAETQGGPYAKVNAAFVTASAYTDTGLTNDVTYYYVVKATNTGYLESLPSNEAAGTPFLRSGVLGGGCGGSGCAFLAALAALVLARRRGRS